MEKNFNIIICILVSTITSLIISLCMLFLSDNSVITNTKLSDFKIESFSIDTEKSSYSSTYEGHGIITCKDKTNDYLVLVEVVNKTTNEVHPIVYIVHNGNGEISTYDSSYTGATEKPAYEFNIIGFTLFNK